MNLRQALFTELANNASYLFSLPTLGPLQMVDQYLCGGIGIPDQPLKIVKKFGERGQFGVWSQVTFDREGNLAVLGNGQIQVFNNFSPSRSMPMPCSMNAGFTVGPDNNFYLSDSDIQVFSPQGTKVKDVASPNNIDWVGAKIAFRDDGHFLLTNGESNPDCDYQLQFCDPEGVCLTTSKLYMGRNIAGMGFIPAPNSTALAVAYCSLTKTFAVVQKSASEYGIGFYQYNEEIRDLVCVGYMQQKSFCSPISSICFDRVGKLVVCDDNYVNVYSTERTLQQSILCNPASAAVTADGKIIVFGNYARQIFVIQ